MSAAEFIEGLRSMPDAEAFDDSSRTSSTTESGVRTFYDLITITERRGEPARVAIDAVFEWTR